MMWLGNAVSAGSLDKPQVSFNTEIQYATGITLNQGDQTKYIGETISVIATVIPSNASNKQINWTTSNSNVATLSSNQTTSGVAITVTAKAGGKATITAVAADGSGKSASFVLTVNKNVEIESFTYDSSEIQEGGISSEPRVTITGAAKSGPTYSSSNTSVATINSTTGVITGVTEGTTKITVTYVNYDNTKASKEIEIKVTKPPSQADYVNYPVDLGLTTSEHTLIDGTIPKTDWRIFYKDSTYTYIIASDYIPTSKFPSGVFTANNGKYNGYWTSAPVATTPTASEKNNFLFTKLGSVSTGNDNYKSVTYFLDTSKWSSFVNGAYADVCIGGPTIEMMCASWNKTTPNEPLYFGANSTGYTVGKTQSGVAKGDLSIIDYKGFNDTLYFPHNNSENQDVWNDCRGYWLASPSSAYAHRLRSMNSSGHVGDYSPLNSCCGIRPVVRLKSTVNMEKDTNGVWQFK